MTNTDHKSVYPVGKRETATAKASATAIATATATATATAMAAATATPAATATDRKRNCLYLLILKDNYQDLIF